MIGGRGRVALSALSNGDTAEPCEPLDDSLLAGPGRVWLAISVVTLMRPTVRCLLLPAGSPGGRNAEAQRWTLVLRAEDEWLPKVYDGRRAALDTVRSGLTLDFDD